MRFLLDECMDVRVGEWLRGHEHDAVHLRDEGFQRMTDAEIFRKARAENRCILTQDLDFGEIAALMIGQINRVYEVLNRKRPLTPQMIRRLHRDLGIPAEALIKESEHRRAA